MQFGHLAQRLFNTVLAIHPRKAEIVMSALADRLGIISINGQRITMSDEAYDDDSFTSAGANPRGGYDVVGGIAVIPICGTLVQKLGTLRPYSGMTGYDGIRQNFLLALDDPKVDAICFDVDSPGGEVSGCFDLVDTIYGARGRKPIWSILNETAYSAAYAIASAADHITLPRTGGIGSIGVICMHVDWSEALNKNGLKVTFVTYGARKADGAAEAPLSPEALEIYQTQIDAMGRLFDETVARNRGINADAVRELQAATFLGDEGITRGLADAVLAPDAAFRALVGSLS